MSNKNFIENFDLFKSNGVFFSDKKILIYSLYNKVFQFDKLTNKSKYLGCVRVSWFDNMFKYFRFYQRLRRLVFYNIIPIPNNRFFLNFSNKIGLLNEKGKFIPLDGISSRFKILNNGLCQDESYIYFGEYLSNNNRNRDINIYRFSKTKLTYEVIFKFPAGKIRHIHGIYKDPFSKHFYVLTGDLPNECGIYVSRDEFKSIELLGGGDETWRAVSIIFTEDLIYYGTDSEFIPNNVYLINKSNLKRKKLGELSGPVYYSVLYKKNPLFFITAELCPSQKDEFFKIIQFENGKLKTKCKILKDLNYQKYLTRIFVKTFMPGNMHLSFHNDKNIEELFLYGIALKNADNKIFKLK